MHCLIYNKPKRVSETVKFKMEKEAGDWFMQSFVLI